MNTFSLKWFSYSLAFHCSKSHDDIILNAREFLNSVIFFLWKKDEKYLCGNDKQSSNRCRKQRVGMWLANSSSPSSFAFFIRGWWHHIWWQRYILLGLMLSVSNLFFLRLISRSSDLNKVSVDRSVVKQSRNIGQFKKITSLVNSISSVCFRLVARRCHLLKWTLQAGYCLMEECSTHEFFHSIDSHESRWQ